jgi:hypothetical protein
VVIAYMRIRDNRLKELQTKLTEADFTINMSNVQPWATETLESGTG